MKTVEFLDAVKAAYGLTSDYQLAKKLSTGTSRIANYRSGRSFMDDSLALQIADLLDVDPLRVMASVHVEREERTGNYEMLNFWKDVAKRASKGGDILTNSAAA
jgi:transcriptional regulator with XRE-family HTH domain